MTVEKSDEKRVYNNFSEGYLNAMEENIQIWAKSRAVIQVVESQHPNLCSLHLPIHFLSKLQN